MAVRNDFSSGEVLTAADLNDTFASKVDYALPTNAQTGTAYTFVAADAEKLTTASNGSAVTLTIPPASSVAWPDNTVLRVVNYGAGAVTIDGGSGVTVTNTSSTIAQYGAAVAIRTGSDAWTVVPFGGGDVPSATVSSPAATGQYTDTGITYDYYTFTASGTLTVDTAGFADVLVIGGGGSGGRGYGGGGGAGGYLLGTDIYLSAGTATVTVGAGGAANDGSVSGNDGQPGSNGNASFLDVYVAPGGGAGSSFTRSTSGPSTLANPSFAGGSGGGGTGDASTGTTGGAGVSTLGNAGGTGASDAGGGGGGAGAVGGNAVTGTGGNGGAGSSSSITGSAVTRAGGGGGGSTTGGSGGTGGGGAGVASGTATSGTANTGGGGGGTRVDGGITGAGGSGVVIVRVKV